MESSIQKGVVIQAFGRFFAGIIDMNLEEYYKVHMDFAEEPFLIKEVSPFSIVGNPDMAMQKYAQCERTNTRVKADIRKNFDEICRKAHCDYLVIDNSSALMELFQIGDNFYSIVNDEKTDFIDKFYNKNEQSKKNLIQPLEEGFSQRLMAQYDLFIKTIL